MSQVVPSARPAPVSREPLSRTMVEPHMAVDEELQVDTGSGNETADSGGLTRPNVLVLGTADWDAPIATNQHYVARELARAAEVTFVESLGLRRPTLRRADVVRMASRVRSAVGGRPAVQQISRRHRPEHMSVVSPLVVPVHRAPTRPVNRALLHRATAGWLRSPAPRVLWTFTPVTYGLETAADLVVYHCVDLLGTVPGIDAAAVAHGERRLASVTRVAIATSTAVADHLRETGFARVMLLPNVADVEVFTADAKPAAGRRPAALFSGNLTPHKLDVPLLGSIASAVSGHGELLLAGPLAAGGGDFGPHLRRLESLGARYLGVLTHEQLARVAGECSVGLIPYAINDYTRGVSPLKCFEYLASGLAVLSTPVPAVADLAGGNGHVTVTDSRDLPSHLLPMLTPPADETIRDRVSAAAGHGWTGRGSVLRELLTRELSGDRLSAG